MLSIDFDTTKFTKNIEGMQFAAIPEAQKKSFFKFGMLNKKKMEPYMKFIFRNPVPLTLKSVLYKVEDENSMFFFIRSVDKGNSPRKYLAPVEFKTGGKSTAYETKFSYWLRNYSGLGLSNKYPIPILSSSAVKTNARGTGMRASQYTTVKAGLKNSQSGSKIKGNQFRYFTIPSQGKKSKNSRLADGIYRVKGNQIGLLFALAKKQPQVPQKFMFFAQTANTLKKDMPAIFKSELRKALAKIK